MSEMAVVTDVGRRRTRTFAPAPTRAGVTWPPTNPLAPVTRTMGEGTQAEACATLMGTVFVAGGFGYGGALGVLSKCQQREVVAVHVIAQVKHAREAGAGACSLRPR